MRITRVEKKKRQLNVKGILLREEAWIRRYCYIALTRV